MKHRPLNFEKFAAEGNHFINDVASELGVTRNTAARITKAVLQALRDRMPPDDAIQFAQGLPMALKGVFIDQYDISDTPVIIRRGKEFLDYIYYKNECCADTDFPDYYSIENGLRAVFDVLSDHMDPGQMNQVKNILGHEITAIIDAETAFR